MLLLIDPSVYISEEIKTLNMYIICAMANVLNCLEIKYSIVLMGDEVSNYDFSSLNLFVNDENNTENNQENENNGE